MIPLYHGTLPRIRRFCFFPLSKAYLIISHLTLKHFMVFYYPKCDDVHMKPGSETELSTLTKSWSLLAPLPLNTLNLIHLMVNLPLFGRQLVSASVVFSR